MREKERERENKERERKRKRKVIESYQCVCFDSNNWAMRALKI